MRWLSTLFALSLMAPTVMAQTRGQAPSTPPLPPAAGRAQAASPADGAKAGPKPGEIETAPIRCWWKTDTAEVRIGQRFGVTLTCGVIETRSLKVVAGTNQLDPGAIPLTPFEVVSGARRDDILAPPWRYFQFDYQVRLLSEGFFGQDVNVPSVNVTYNIQAGSAGVQGRDQTYVLPPLPVRVASLVPRDASDIRDASTEGFGAIAERRFRATSATVTAGILFGLAGVLVLVAALRTFGRVRQRHHEAVRSLPPAVVLHGALRALGHLKSEVTRQGWSPELARRALALLRVAGAVGINRPLAQSPALRDTQEREGQLKLRHGLVRPRWTLVSGATTPQGIERELSSQSSSLPAATRTALDQIGAGLRALGTAAYGRVAELDATALDTALGQAIEGARYLRWRSVWPPVRAASSSSPPSAIGTPSMSSERLT